MEWRITEVLRSISLLFSDLSLPNLTMISRVKKKNFFSPQEIAGNVFQKFIGKII